MAVSKQAIKQLMERKFPTQTKYKFKDFKEFLIWFHENKLKINSTVIETVEIGELVFVKIKRKSAIDCAFEATPDEIKIGTY
jgi:hypothetical protein